MNSKDSRFLLILYLVLIFLFGAYFYFLYEVWTTFGGKAIVISIVVQLLSALILHHLIGSQKKTDSGYIFNPKELPKYLNMLVALVVGGYLYTVLGTRDISSGKYDFGLIYILLGIVIPVLYGIYKLYKNRNDYIEVTDTTLKYFDNNDQADGRGEVLLSNIQNVRTNGFLSLMNIELLMKDSSTLLIKTSEMNFNVLDLWSLKALLNMKIGNFK